jgi:two-component system, chemotaxis family, sensor kinase CheA
MSDSPDSNLLNLFWVEVSEYLQTLNSGLLQIETRQVSDEESLLREMNRIAHSMKGAARSVGISLIETIAHYMEDIFDGALRKVIELKPDVCDLLYDGLDLIQNVVDGEENSAETLAEVLARLEQVIGAMEAKSRPKPSAQQTQQTAKRTTSIPITNTAAAVPSDTGETLILRAAEETIRVTVSKLDRLMGEASELLVARMHAEERQREINHLRKLHGKWQHEWRAIRAAYIRLARRMDNQPEDITSELATLFKFLETNQRHLTESMRQLNQLAQSVAQDNMRLSTLAEQLQDDISGMRLVPFETLVGGFQRIARDLARDTGKQIQLDISGATVELDKTVLDALKDPIMHLLRNAVDHGIELPAERERLGKSPAGRVMVNLEQHGSEIEIQVVDDGRGISPNHVKRAAIKAGLLNTQEAEVMNDDDARQLIFHPGLTTNDSVTSISGRGLGMDIVRDRVESLRGRVTVSSISSRGTAISLLVPVSLTRIRCILLRAGDQNFALPSAVVRRMVTIEAQDIFTAEGREIAMIEGRPMPLVPLHAVLEIPAPERDPAHTQVTGLVVDAADRTVAFEVEALHSEQELVLKPLGPELERAPYVSGAALLGTGDVIIVLDANNLARGASGISVQRRKASAVSVQKEQRRLRVLVVDDSITTRTLEKNILETVGFDVRVAIDGVEAWSMLAEHDFDVVVSDVEMPRMDGLELTRRIKGTSGTQHLPVILLTSLEKPEQREAGLKAGADRYLVKSAFDQSELLYVIESVV